MSSPVILPFKIAQQMQRDYCCAGCWGHLAIDPIPEQPEEFCISCPNCGDGRGFVTKTFIVRRRSEDLGDYLQVKNMLQETGVLSHTRRSAQEILAELGY